MSIARIATVNGSLLTDLDMTRLKDKNKALFDASETFKRYAIEHMRQAADLLEENEFEQAAIKLTKATNNLQSTLACINSLNTVTIDPIQDASFKS